MNDIELHLAVQSPVAQAMMQDAISLQKLGETEKAKHQVANLLAQFPECVASLHLSFQCAMAEQAYSDAESYLALALEQKPDHPVLLLSKAQLNLKQSNYIAAIKYAMKAVDSYKGNSLAFLSAVAGLVMQADKPDLAIAVYRRMLSVEPMNLQVMHQLALCLFFTNDITGSAELLDTVIRKSQANAGAIHLRSALKTYTKAANHIAELEQRVAKGGAHPAVYYALAKELEDIGEYQKSFLVLQQGAALMRKNISYNEEAELAAINGIITSTADIQIEPMKADMDGPIFIVGMPRTGTTLVERILLQHDSIYSLGEFSLFPQLLSSMANEYLSEHKNEVKDLHQAAMQIDFAELGRRYIAGAKAASGGRSCTIDKLPVNFLYCGFIKKALPNARIIHLSRNAMDSCYAIFKTLFINAYSFSYDLQELANYYATYRKVMAHWHRIMPGQIFELHYEALVTDAEKTAQQLSDWCGLSFKPELLDFHSAAGVSTTASAAQIRKPIYSSSVQKWRNLEAELNSLRDSLERAGIAL